MTESSPNITNRTIFTGDNLPIMRGMNSEFVDLIYLDPPFNSKADYAAPIGSKAAGAEFKDMWTLSDIDIAWLDLIENKYPFLNKIIQAALNDSDKSYLVYMAVRLLEMHRILKTTGSLYLHCDPKMSHYLKLVMDVIFKPENFRNEIIWHYTGGGRSKTYFSRKHDVIFWYTKSARYSFNIDAIRQPYKETSGYAKGGITSKAGKHYAPHPKGTPADDVWDIPILNPNSPLRTGYPTQKPPALLERIIKASSHEDDIVFDPFCGCATTLVVADDLRRSWAGIDISPLAIELVKKGMKEYQALFYDVTHRADIPKRTDLGRLLKYNSSENKDSLYGKQGGNCTGCKVHFQKQHLQIDHIIARSQGGTDHRGNLQLLCGHCNSIKGTRGMSYLVSRLNQY